MKRVPTYAPPVPLTGPDLRAARVRAGFATTEAFAKEVGASPRAVQDWELAKSMPQPRYRARIDDVLAAARLPRADPDAGGSLSDAVIETALTQATPMQLLTAWARLLSRLDPALSLPEQPLRWPRTDSSALDGRSPHAAPSGAKRA